MGVVEIIWRVHEMGVEIIVWLVLRIGLPHVVNRMRLLRDIGAK